PNNGDTTDAQVKMQGGLSFDNVPVLQGAGIQADVKDTNYVIADHNGITITGATITKTWQLDKVTIAGGINVGYDMSSKTFTFGGQVEVTTEQQGNGKVALKQLAADINASIHEGNVETFSFSVSGSFQILESLTVSVVGASNQPFTFSYNTDQQQ